MGWIKGRNQEPNGTPQAATIAHKVPNEDAWIIGLHNDVYMKMVKIQITGPNTFSWIASKYSHDGSYDENCLTSFKYSCFKGSDTIESNYQVQLVARFGEEFCVNITTATRSTWPYSDGLLQVFVNNVSQFQEKKFDFGETVIDACFPNLDTISVKDMNDDGWVGEILVRKNGVVLKISCIDCSGSEFDRKIVVDGNDDGRGAAPTECLNGNLCTLKV